MFFATKPRVCMIMSLLGIPVCIGAFGTNFSLGFCLFCQALEYLLSEGWTPPTVAMILTVIDPKYKGMAVSLFLFTTTVSGTIALVVLGKIEDMIGKDN